jgi:sarcosine oxidase subunit alpha
MSSSHPVARTPLHHWHAARGARFADSDGWQVPLAYVSAEREVAAAREALALADLSGFAKLSLQGQGVPALAQALVGDGPAAKPLGVAPLVAEDRVLACRLTADHLLLLAATTTAAPLEERLAQLPPGPPVVQSAVTSAYAGFGLVGPCLDDLLGRVTALDVAAALPVNACAETGLAGVHALLVRAPELSVPAVRVYVSWDLAEYVWDRLLDAGRDWGITPLGLEGFRALALPAPNGGRGEPPRMKHG